MQNKPIQKWITILFTAFVIVFLSVGTGITTQTAYADKENPTTEEICKAINPAGTYLGANGSCFIPKGESCASLDNAAANIKKVTYEPTGDADEKGIACQKKVDVKNTDPEKEKTLKNTVYFLIGFEQFLNTVIWPVLVMSGDLMNNNILFGAGMDERLREIWIPIRNLINLFFVLAMVAIAIYNILGIGDDNDTYSIKQILPKMIIAIIAVNFSFMGIKVFLDGINLLTTSIFALPDQVKEGLGDIEHDPEMVTRFCLGTTGKTVNSNLGEIDKTTSPTDLDEISTKLVILSFAEKNPNLLKTGGGAGVGATPAATLNMLKQDFQIANITAAEMATVKQSYFTDDGQAPLASALAEAKLGRVCTNDAKLTPRGKAFLMKYNSENAALAMALNMSKIVFYPEIDLTTLTEANISKLFINTIFSVAMYLIYVASFIALFIVLLARLVVLWLGVVASPIIIVAMVLPVFKEKLGFGELIDKFVQNAIAPILIAGAMTVGWIMLRAIQNVNVLSSGIPNLTNGIPVAGLNTLQDLMVAVGAIAILWTAVFAAASKSIAAPVTDKIKGYLSGAGSFVGGLAAKHVPLFPVTIPGHPEIKNVTPEMFEQVLKDAKYKYNDKESDNAKAMSTALGLRDASDRRLSDLPEAKDSKDALGLMRKQYREIETGGEAASKSLKAFLDKSIGTNFKKKLEEARGPRTSDFKNMIEEFEKAKAETERETARKKMAKHLYDYGSEMETEMDQTAAAKKGPKPTPPPPAVKPPKVSATDTIGGGSDKVGAAGVAKITDAAKELAAAVTATGKTEAVKKAEAEKILQKFEVEGNKATVLQLTGFINDETVSKKLKALFGKDDAAIKKAIDKTTTASAAPQPPTNPNEQSPGNPTPP
ncbi:MAG: hypothetical protein Q8P62_05120 [Candidatus Peregrinibacteria bacterium]|nr:hypothetical protein [Candidatus Peregrinibacteria bacterium]